ncbi:UNVERIFIED_CONTAM: hypothetical protein NCL1_49575 [Trichonephila clavipes]
MFLLSENPAGVPSVPQPAEKVSEAAALRTAHIGLHLRHRRSQGRLRLPQPQLAPHPQSLLPPQLARTHHHPPLRLAGKVPFNYKIYYWIHDVVVVENNHS